MAARRAGVPFDATLYGGVEKGRIDTRPVADDPLQKSGVTAVTASDPMLAKNPDIA
jgi:hypothetical protein